MHNLIFPVKDNTIYSKYPYKNMGLDEILEISKEVTSSIYEYRGTWNSGKFYDRYDYILSESTYYFSVAENIGEDPATSNYWKSFSPSNLNDNSRILIQFDLSDFDSDVIASASNAYINLYTSIARGISMEYDINIFPISESWEMGVGNYTEKLTEDASSWKRRSSTETWTLDGGDYYTSVSGSQSFNFNNTDLRMDVSDIYNSWIAGDITNNGFIIKRSDSQESDGVPYGSLSFYSMDTHTIYLPTLEAIYDDQIYDTSSFYPLNATGSVSASLLSGSVNICVKNIKENYKYNSKIRLEVQVKPTYKRKTFYESVVPGLLYYLSNNIYYSVRDAYTNRIIIPFSDYTKVSLDENGYYFDLILSGFMPERYYKILLKSEIDGSTQYFNNCNEFKVIK